MSSLPFDPPADPSLHDPGPDAAGARALAVERAASEPLVTPHGATIRIGTASWTDPTMTVPWLTIPYKIILQTQY